MDGIDIFSLGTQGRKVVENETVATEKHPHTSIYPVILFRHRHCKPVRVNI